MKISLGPVPLNWKKEKLFSFYERVANSPVGNVYLGEIICPEREPTIEDLIRIICMLKEKEKRVYISSYALIGNGLRLENIKKLLEISDGLEINNPAFLNFATEKEMIAGPLLNVYNWRTAKYYSKFGVKKVVIPWEVGRKTIEDIAQKSGMNIEVVVHGHLPLALSRECYTVRTLSSFDNPYKKKDGLHLRELILNSTEKACAKECFQYPEGFLLKAMSGELLYKINGPQVFSAKVHCLIEHLDYLRKLEVDSIRIESQLEEDTGEVIDIYRKVLDNHLDMKDAVGILKVHYSDDLCNGFFSGRPGWEYC